MTICEPALRPSPGATTLLFPIADTVLDHAEPSTLVALHRPLPLVYVGNQYDRDDAFDTFFAPAARRFAHRVAGKWTHTEAWPHVRFTGRCPFSDVEPLYRSALATVLLLPDRYARAGQMTQRLFEAVLSGCVPITPANIAESRRFTPTGLHAANGHQVIAIIERIQANAGTPDHAALLAECLPALDKFRVSHQIVTIRHILQRPAEPTSVPGVAAPASSAGSVT